MTVPFIIFMAGLVFQVCTETPQSLIPLNTLSECCADISDESGLCPQRSSCHSGCYRHWFKNGSTTCIRCPNETLINSLNNRTECIISYFSSEEKVENGTTVGPTILKIASILQPNEMAEIMRSPMRSVRKQRYSRRERLSASTASFASTAISNV
ncbi:uncharacterized protein C1orf159 homolog isoform X4 [Stegostoma tigrinum]|uniref:uncharacterized protein C1orf159 homolog isoform X4 n=1 Tax=Stegostoma tigrinum TaxID=3053191 RepID=UPI00202B3582|nr:uncharacterized protein C1orf159 homolog isoform X4 [Stegostoma tigrinum]